jgi:hypothetical protein
MATRRFFFRPLRQRVILPGIWRDFSPSALRGASQIGRAVASFSPRCWLQSPFETYAPVYLRVRPIRALERPIRIA